jgi:hypothetical protein
MWSKKSPISHRKTANQGRSDRKHQSEEAQISL